ncbi:MAG TPA: hypothetical protein VGQ00_03265 [Candidatus Norongarragalinales archaeon]|jgi:hypothetical protein|nr:hypothetical protein [Candidatus Norongarragalinales archaeon]
MSITQLPIQPATTDSAPKEFKKRFAIYRANAQGTGAAMQVDFNKAKESAFFEFAKQKAGTERSFDWSEKITLKVSEFEMGKIIALANGKIPQVKLFHAPSKGGYAIASEVANTTLEASKSQYGYGFRISTQAQDKSVKSVSVTVSEEEMQVLQIALSKGIASLYDW